MKKKNSVLKTLYIITLLTVVSVPFDGLTIEVGATFRLSNVFSLLATFLLASYLLLASRQERKSIPKTFSFILGTLFLFCLITFLGNLTFLLDTVSPEAQRYFEAKFGSDGFSSFRTVLKPLQVFIANTNNFSWLLIPILVIKRNHQVIQLAWFYVISSSIEAVLGIIQYLYFLASGINIFPIYRGGLIGENNYTQDAVVDIQGIRFLRVNAFAGEPKGLAFFLCIGIAIICFFLIRHIKKNRILLFGCLCVHLVALALTFSTLGYICIVIGFFVYSISIKNKFPLILILGFLLVSFYYLFDVPDLAVSVFQERFLDRLGFEDMDLVYLAFIQKSPDYLLFGTGFGTFHLASFKQAQEIIPWAFGIILPKFGILNILATSGCVGLIVFSILLFRLFKNLHSIISLQKQNNFYIDLKNLIIYLVIVGISLRVNLLGFLWIGVGFATIENHLKYKQSITKYLQIIESNI